MEKEKISVGAVSYLNTKPLLYGIERLPIRQQVTLITDYPANIAAQLLNGKIDVGLVPVTIIPGLASAHIITNYCIGAVGQVASVALFSQKPIEEVDTVLLDYQSNTSVMLVKILLKNYWKKTVTFKPAFENFEQHINGSTAGVVIGDRAFAQRLVSAYVYDLAEAWLAYTNLPFVFAAWVANKKLSPAFIQAFNNANQLGFQHLPEIIAQNQTDKYDLQTYYTQNISYELTAEKRKGLSLFLQEAATYH